MTEPLPPLTDEELSAVADGEAGPEIVARVEADPAAQARVDAFAAAGTALRTTPVTPLDAATVDRLVARSVAEAGRAGPGPADDAGDAGDADGSDADGRDVVAAPVTPTAGRIARAPWWLVAAAVVTLVAAGLGLIWSGQRGGDDQVASTGADAATETSGETSDETSEETSGEAPAGDNAAAPDDTAGEDGAASEAPDGAGAAPGEAPGPHGEVPPSTAGAGRVTAAEITDLGDFVSPDELRERLGTEFPDDLPLTSDSAPGNPTTGTAQRCRDQVQQVFGIETMPTATGLAVIDDQPVLVYEFDAPSFADGTPTTLVVGVGPEACNSVLTFER
jgi:hypothetical protein